MIHYWPSYNQSLVRRGEIFFAYDFLDIWDDDLASMNENKNGKKYQFPNSFILLSLATTEYTFTYLTGKQRGYNQGHRKKFAKSSKLFTDL